MAQITIKDQQREGRVYTGRVLVALVIVAAMLGVLISRYYHLQITDYEKYRTESDRNRIHVVPVAPRRGLIFDRNGVILAENQPSYNLIIVRESVQDLDAELQILRDAIGITDDEIDKYRVLAKRQRPFEGVPLRFRLTEEEIARIAVDSYRLPGFEVEAQLVRYYPHGELLAHTVGYVGRINDQEQASLDPENYAASHHIGKTGLERYYEDDLHGKVGFQYVETNARGQVLRVLENKDPISGSNLTLSLDVNVQRVAQDALAGYRGAVVALEPATGAVLALVSNPGFDPNLFVNGISGKNYQLLRDSPDTPLLNRALQGQYPPGSTVKPMLGLGGLYYGIVTPSSTVPDPGWYQLSHGGRYYRDWKRGGHGGRVDLRLAIEQSCDVYFYDLANRMGIDRLSAFAGRFGIGQATGVDQTSERPGVLPTRHWKKALKRQPWFPGETLNVGIGQGYMLTTPMQLAHMTAILANRGKIVKPRLVQKRNGETLVPEVIGHVDVSPQHWQAVIEGMKDVIHSERGTAKGINKGIQYTMAGKTGTAQVVGIKQKERYDASKLRKTNWDHALFIAFAPVDDPKIAVAVMVENGEHGSTTAAPVARKVMDAYLLSQYPEGQALIEGSVR